MKFPFLIFRISGHSMEPAIKDGSLVLVWQWGGNYRVGEVVVFKNGQEDWVKRVVGTADGLLQMEGDNKADSHPVVPVPAKKVLGRVIRVF